MKSNVSKSVRRHISSSLKNDKAFQKRVFSALKKAPIYEVTPDQYETGPKKHRARLEFLVRRHAAVREAFSLLDRMAVKPAA